MVAEEDLGPVAAVLGHLAVVAEVVVAQKTPVSDRGHLEEHCHQVVVAVDFAEPVALARHLVVVEEAEVVAVDFRRQPAVEPDQSFQT